MARVLFGSILIPDDADEAYLASLGLSEKDIKEAMQNSPHYDAGYKITDPLKAAKRDITAKAENDDIDDGNKDLPGSSENSEDDPEKETQYAADDVVYDYGGCVRTWKSVFKPIIKRRKEDVTPIKQESDVTEWVKFSLTPHTEDEIREKILTSYKDVCFAYICAHQKLSEDFIIELAALSTGLLYKYNYSENIDYLKHAVMISAGIEEGPYDFGMLPEGCKFTLENVQTLTTDRLDWRAIAVNQKLSKRFIKKYHSLLYPNSRDTARCDANIHENAS